MHEEYGRKQDLLCIRTMPRGIVIKECINKGEELSALITSKGLKFRVEW